MGKKKYSVIISNDCNACLKKVNALIGKKIIILTENHNIKSKVEENKDIIFIPLDMELEFFDFKTWEIIRRLNSIIKNVKTLNDCYLYEMSYLIEGGNPQLIEEIIYSINVYDLLLQKYDIESIFYEESTVANEIAVKAYAKSVRLNCFKIGKTKNKKNKIIFSKIPLVRLGYYIYFWSKVIHEVTHHAGNSKNNFSGKYPVAVLFTGKSKKSIKWVIDSIENLGGNKCCVVCFNTDTGMKYISENKIPCINIESYLEKNRVYKIEAKYIWDIWHLGRVINRDRKKIFVKGIDITDLIKCIFLNEIRINALRNILFAECAKGLLKCNDFKLYIGDGDSNFIQNKVVYFEGKKLGKDIIFFKDSSNMIEQYKTIAIYEPYGDLIKYRAFCSGSPYLDALKRGGWNGSPVITNRNIVLKTEYNTDQGLNKKKVIKLFWAPSYPLPGIYSSTHFYQDNRSVIELSRYENIEIYVKFHPNITKDDEEFVKKDIIENRYDITFIEHTEIITKYISESDIIITTPSTVIMDSFSAGKPVICLAEGMNYSLVNRLEDFFVILPAKKLEEYLKEVILGKVDRDKFVNDIIKRQRLILEVYKPQNGDLSTKEIVEKLIEREEIKYNE
ncbi:hypothetical protein D5278_17790 [bacterium 1XD21-13]|nr:hypothetical protein [bacterium 1XD21-13]